MLWRKELLKISYCKRYVYFKVILSQGRSEIQGIIFDLKVKKKNQRYIIFKTQRTINKSKSYKCLNILNPTELLLTPLQPL